MITPIKKENATDQIYMQLLDMIFTDSWSAGSKIPSEAELSKQFGVSRVPVREALQRLNAMGIITSQQGRGAFVNAAPSSDILSVYLAMLGNKDFELKDLLEYRMLVEPYCAKYMAANGTEDFFQNLLQYCPNPDGPDYNESRVFQLDVHFHNQIVSGVNNSIIRLIQLYSSSVMERHVSYFADIHKDPLRIAREHYGIYSAMRNRNTALAEELMRKHILYVLRLINADQ